MTTLPRWAAALLRRLAPPGEADDVIGDLEEAHQHHQRLHSPAVARVHTTVESIDLAVALIRTRTSRLGIRGGTLVQDYRLGVRMLLKYPGLTLAGGLALAIAIGIGAGWYDMSHTFWRPTLPFPNGNHLVEIEMRNAASSREERRLLHDFATWRDEARTVTDLGAYRTVQLMLGRGDAPPQPAVAAEITASAFRLTSVPPFLGRPLIAADERPGAPPVVVLGYHLWRTQFGGRHDLVGQVLKVGTGTATVVGVMPEGFAFPVNHNLWMPLAVTVPREPMTGPEIRVFGKLAAGATQAEANTELMTLVQRAAAESPRPYERLSPRVLAYGGESPGDRGVVEFLVTHGPVLLVLLVACINVGTLVYARTATREAEIATRHALGASRWRIVSQLFIEAFVLASASAVVGLAVAHWALQWGIATYYAGQTGGPPFWIHGGLEAATVLYAGVLTVAGAALLGVLPALRVTSAPAIVRLRASGVGGSTLRFGPFWTTAMVAQVAATVVCLPPAYGISQEAVRDHLIRTRFPAETYLAVELEFDSGGDTADAEHAYAEFERRVAQEPGVAAVTYGSRLPGMGPAVRTAEVELRAGAAPVRIPALWTTTVGPRYFESFGIPILAGRDFDAGDRRQDARTVLVNEAFVRRYLGGGSPVGTRVRYASLDPTHAEPWFEIVGLVRDIGMTPTDLGEAPYLFRAASPTTVSPLVMGVKAASDAATLAPRVRALASELEVPVRVEIRTLDDHVWRVDLPMLLGAGAIVTVVGLGLFLSAAGIFALMSVAVARRTREIGLRTALGASRGRLVAGIFSRATSLLGAGILTGNAVLLLVVGLSDEADIIDVAPALALTSSVMLLVGLLACLEPARRALRIQPIDALKDV